MSVKNNSLFKNIIDISKEEKIKKAVITYTITGVCCLILLLLKVNFVASIIASLVCSFSYYLFAPTPKIKPKKEKKKKKRSSLDEEYLKEFDAENNNK